MGKLLLYDEPKYDLQKYKALWGQLNKETKRHCVNVANICEYIAGKIGLDPEIAYKIGYLHDLGKIYIPSRILKKNCKLSAVEREVVDSHSYIGYALLRDLGESPIFCLTVLYHHGFNKCQLNHVNTSVADSEIKTLPYLSLIHTADVYDARISRRPYHDIIDSEIIFEGLRNDGFCDDVILKELVEYDAMMRKKS